MEDGERSDFDSSNSSPDASDVEIDEIILPALENVIDIPGFSALSVETSRPGGSGVAEEKDELLENAFKAVEGDLSVEQFEGKLGGRATTKISPFLSSLIGQANMCYVRGECDEALRLCKEAIRADPTVAEPYRTMSEMYEELGEHHKALQLGMIAAVIINKDADYWTMLGEKAAGIGQKSDAIYCYQKALKKDRSNYNVLLALIKLFDPEKDKRSIIHAYQKLVKHAPVELGAQILEFAQKGCLVCHEDNDLHLALAMMETAFQRVPSAVRLDDVNLLIELYGHFCNYRHVLQVITKYCNVYIEGIEDVIESEGRRSEVFRVIQCKAEGELQPQIRAKLIIALIHLQAFHLIEPIIAPFADMVEEYGDQILDMAEAYMTHGHYLDALKLLKLLTNSVNFNAAQVWHDYAECLRNLGRKEEAVSAYLVVMDKAPQHTEAKIVVSELLNELGRGEEAISALAQDPSSGILDVGVLYERCMLLKGNPAKTADFLAVGRLLLSRHCARFRNRVEYINFIRFWKIRTKQEALKRYQENLPEEPVYIEGKRMPTNDEEFALFMNLCQTAFDTKQYALLQRLASSALGSKILCSTNEREITIYNLTALAVFFNNDSSAGYHLYKNFVLHGRGTARVWNIFNFLVTHSDDSRWHKYIIRFLRKQPNHPVLPSIFATNCFTSNSYKQSLSEYLLQFKREPTALVALMIAVCCVHIALQKSTENINVIIAQAVGFISEYKQLRGEECAQEIHYNFGKLYHQLGILPNAIYHYKKALETPAPVEMFDLKRDAAFNLSRIYIASKSFDLARHYVQKYIVV